MTTQDEANPFAPPAEDDVYTPVEAHDAGGRPLATLGARFAGSMIDGIIYMVPLVPTMIFATAGEEAGIGDNAFTLGMICWTGIFIYQMYLVSTTGQSIGKKLVNTRIIREDGSDVDFVSGVVLRMWVIALLAMVPFLGSILQLADPLFIFGDRRQCLHDKIAKTLVIDVTHGG